MTWERINFGSCGREVQQRILVCNGHGATKFVERSTGQAWYVKLPGENMYPEILQKHALLYGNIWDSYIRMPILQMSEDKLCERRVQMSSLPRLQTRLS